MRHCKDVILRGAQIVRHLKGQQDASPNEKGLALAELPLAAGKTAARALLSRRLSSEEDLDDFFSAFDLGGSGGGNGEDESDDLLASLLMGGMMGGAGGGDMMGGGGSEGGDDFLSAMMGGAGMMGGVGGDDDLLAPLMESVEECGIDMETMMTKALGAFMLYGSDLQNVDPSDPDTYPDAEHVSQMLMALKDDDETDCDEGELAQVVAASQDYLQCTGMGEFLDLDEFDSEGFNDKIEGACKPAFDLVMAISAEEDLDVYVSELERLMAQTDTCLKTLLADNPVGNIIRYEYNHMDKILGCLGEFGSGLPHCIAPLPTQDEAGQTRIASFPLSIEKKLLCLAVATKDLFVASVCLGLYEFLDESLPQVGDDAGENGEFPLLLIGSGALELGDGTLGIDSSVITGDQVPAFCKSAFEDLWAAGLQERLDYWNDNRAYGWTLETLVEGNSNEVDAIPAVPARPEVAEASPPASNQEPEQPYNPELGDVISSVESIWEDGEEEASEGPSATGDKSFAFVIVALALVAAIAAALFVKYRGLRATSQPGRKNVAYSDLALKVEHSEMA